MKTYKVELDFKISKLNSNDKLVHINSDIEMEKGPLKKQNLRPNTKKSLLFQPMLPSFFIHVVFSLRHKN